MIKLPLARIGLCLILLGVSWTVFADSDSDPDPETEASTLTPPLPMAEKEWTVLVYLNGHNDLDTFGKMNVDQMTQVGSSNDVNVVVQWASIQNGNTKRLYVKKGSYDVIQDMPAVNMGDYNNLVEFIRWGQANYPAKKYFIDVWNHGNGWHLQARKQIHPKDISYDDVFHTFITTEQLAEALSQAAQITGQKIELYASDACMMAMTEVGAQMADSVHFFAGSEETEPGEGWPYAVLLPQLISKPSMDGGELAKNLSQDYQAAYSGGVYGQQQVTFAAWDLSKMDHYYSAVKSLTQELLALDPASLKLAYSAIASTQGFALPDYKDLTDYLDVLAQSKVPLQANTVTEVKTAISEFMLSSDVTSAYSRAHGISIWLPSNPSDWNDLGARYSALKFNQLTGWGDFIKLIVQNSPPPAPGSANLF